MLSLYGTSGYFIGHLRPIPLTCTYCVYIYIHDMYVYIYIYISFLHNIGHSISPIHRQNTHNQLSMMDAGDETPFGRMGFSDVETCMDLKSEYPGNPLMNHHILYKHLPSLGVYLIFRHTKIPWESLGGLWVVSDCIVLYFCGTPMIFQWFPSLTK